MPGKLKNRYNLVDDAGDARVPLHNEEAFQHGIRFQAKYIGSLDVPRPNSRVEIVAAMRRIRYEFKAKNVKKRKVNIVVSVDGVKVLLRKKQKRKEWTWDEGKMMVMHDPVYRIFYVSHDSQDLKIFSYIARDGTNNSFRCNVFKSKKKAQAMRVVRTVGQAFEVCHKLSLQHALQNGDGQADGASNNSADDSQPEGLQPVGPASADKDNSPDASKGPCLPDCSVCESPLAMPDLGNLKTGLSPKARTSQENTNGSIRPSSAQPLGRPGSPCSSNSATPLASQHRLQLLQHQLFQQQQQTQVAIAQVQLLKDQLSAETMARVEAQARVRQLLLTHRDLLQHVASLARELKELEIRVQEQHPGDRLLQHLNLAHSLSLNLENHYSLEISWPSTLMPGGRVGSPTYKSYQNLAGLEKGSGLPLGLDSEEELLVLEGPDGLRSVEGSEADDCRCSVGSAQLPRSSPNTPAREKRLQLFIPKLDPPPPTVRRRSSKAISPCLDPDRATAATKADPAQSEFIGLSVSSLSHPESEGRVLGEGQKASGCLQTQGCLSQDGRVQPWAKDPREAAGRQPFPACENTRLHINLSEEELDKACVALA